MQGPPQGAGQGFGLLRGDQVRAGHGTDEQRPAGEQPGRACPVQDQVGEVLGCVPGRCQGPQREPAQVHLVSVPEPAVAELQTADGGGDYLSAPGGQLAASGDEVGMQVRLSRVRDDQSPALRSGQVRCRVALGVNRQGPAVAEVEKIGGVAEALVNHGHGAVGICWHRLSLSRQPGLGPHFH
jgi:hypothetical protein